MCKFHRQFVHDDDNNKYEKQMSKLYRHFVQYNKNKYINTEITFTMEFRNQNNGNSGTSSSLCLSIVSP